MCVGMREQFQPVRPLIWGCIGGPRRRGGARRRWVSVDRARGSHCGAHSSVHSLADAAWERGPCRHTLLVVQKWLRQTLLKECKQCTQKGAHASAARICMEGARSHVRTPGTKREKATSQPAFSRMKHNRKNRTTKRESSSSSRAHTDGPCE
eukprot:2262524-Rhodomonas_salina.3